MLYINQLVKWGHIAVVQHMEPLTASISFAHSVCILKLTALNLDQS